MSEPLTHLATLPLAAPDAGRAERIRARCRRRLEQQAQRASAPGHAAPGDAVRIWQPLVAILGAGYMAEAIRQALRVYGLL